MWCFSWGANSTAAEAFCLISILPSLVLSWKPRCFCCWCFLLKNIEIWLTKRSLFGFWSNFPVTVERVEWLIRHENAKLGSDCGFKYVFNVYPYLGKWSNLTNIFQRGWNLQLARGFSWTSYEFQHVLILLNSIGWGVEAHHWRAWRDVRESRFCKHGGWLFVKFSNVLWLMSGVRGKCCCLFWLCVEFKFHVYMYYLKIIRYLYCMYYCMFVYIREYISRVVSWQFISLAPNTPDVVG